MQVEFLFLCTSSNGGLYLYQVSCKYSWRYCYREDTILIEKISKGHNSVNVGGVTVLFLCTSSYGVLYLYKISRKYSRRYQSYRADRIFIRKISKRDKSVQNVGGVSVLILCILSDDGLYLHQVSWKCLEQYQSYGRTDGRMQAKTLYDPSSMGV